MDREQFEEWKSHPVTIEVFEEVEKHRSALKDALADGATIGSKTHTARVVGNIEGLNQLLNISYEGGDKDGE
jgi:hypothetical protein